MTEQSHAGENLLISWGQELDELDAQIKALQDAKRDFYTSVRDNHGKVTADALKAAQRIRGMDSEKRAKAEEVDAETARILAVLEKPRAPRAMRAREIIEQFPPHDAVTGEIIEQNSSGKASERIDPSTVSVNPNGEPVDGSANAGGNDDDRRMMALTIDSGPGAPVVAAPATISDEDVPAFLKKDERNERCEKQGDCKFAKHPQKVTCSDCGTAWAISQRKRERAE